MVDPKGNEFISRMASAFIPEKAAGLDTSIQINITGDHAGEWYLVIKDQQCTVHEGMAPDARLQVSANSDDLMNIFTGKLDGMQAFMQGKIKVAGDMSLAMKLLGLFKMH